MSTIKFIFIFLLFLATPLFSFSQKSKSRNEAEIFFKQNKYDEAKNIFKNLRDLNPSDVDLTFKLGVCIFFSENYKNAKKWFYLIKNQFNDDMPSEVYYFLGKISQYEYFFENAIEYFEKYEQGTDEKRIWNCSFEKKYCESAIKSLKIKGTTISNSKTEISGSKEKQSFLKEINFTETKQYVVHSVTSDEINKKWSKYNETKNYKPHYLYRKKTDYRIFSSYSKNNQNHKDLFIQYRSDDFEWEKIEKIPLINTDFEEDFPIYDDINHVLYFSSNRKSSFGGFDS